MNLILIGIRGSGKSSVAKLLASRLGLAHVDLDACIEHRAQQSIVDIFQVHGEQTFRKMETEALSSFAGRDRMVLATGGGIVLAKQNRSMLQDLGKIVWLKVSPKTSIERTAKDPKRPALTNLSPIEETRNILKQRAPLYEALADHVTPTDTRPLEEVCNDIEQFWKTAQCDNLW